MNINLENLNLNDSFFSVRIKVINNNNIYDITKIYASSNMMVDVEFENCKKYIVVISIAQFGHQIFKKKYFFKYHTCDEYKLDNNITIINSVVPNDVNIKKIIPNINCNFDINPLASFRIEDDIVSIFVNGNIYLLNGNLKKIFLSLFNKVPLSSLNLKDKDIIEYLQLLILKGCVICHE